MTFQHTWVNVHAVSAVLLLHKAALNSLAGHCEYTTSSGTFIQPYRTLMHINHDPGTLCMLSAAELLCKASLQNLACTANEPMSSGTSYSPTVTQH